MKKFLLIFFLIALLNVCVVAQVSNYVSEVKAGTAKEKTPITITAELISTENISEVFIAYKAFGETEFLKMEMLIVGNTASAAIPKEIALPPYIEYYLIINLKSGEQQTYPMGIDEGVNPLQISVAGVSQKEKEILVLSPSENETLSQDEQLISVSFVRAPESVDVAKTKFYLNGINVSELAVIAGDLIVLAGENIPVDFDGSARNLLIEVYDREGNLYHTINRKFIVVTAEVAAAIESQWKLFGNLRGESRSENLNRLNTWYNNASANFNASGSGLQVSAYGYVTSEEKSDKQPFNRYSASLDAGDWLSIKAGDSYPRFPNLIMEGKRLRGFSGALNLGFFNFQAAFGETARDVEGNILRKYTAKDVILGSDIIKINDLNTPYAKVKLGTYKRKIFVVRPSFGSGENFQLGFSSLYGKDEVNSIKYGARPQENIVIGSDLMLAFDEKNIMLTSQAAISFLNKDISSGSLTNAQIDSIFGPGSSFDVDPEKVKEYRDYIDKFITVNQYLGPWNPQELASFGAEAALSLNYLNNNIKASYIYRGNDFHSFGQSFLRTDVRGINIVDRIRMLDNKLFISLGYEDLQDNLQNTKIATTKFRTVSASVSLFPRADFPNITVGYNRFSNSNGIVVTNPKEGKYAIDDQTNRILVQLSYDFSAGIKHSSSVSFTKSDREDNGAANSDAQFNNLSLNLNSFWDKDLMSVFGFVYSSSEISNIPFNYFTFTAGGRYRMLENKLTLTATLSPSFGNFNRQAFEFVADYSVLKNLNLAFQTRLYRFPGKSTNSILGLITRFTI
ncbi:MAG: hypothetical protein FD143_937 [Ignavibacteria bacterium]|nr:MAG: hypothetical protein FD143_937 [Ignavibacteria bacterium]KAF0161180.1 MAG: hypothetical protein FD188_1091 [Ignavibacteria bacterium]